MNDERRDGAAALGLILTVGSGPLPAATIAAAQSALSEVLIVRIDDVDAQELAARVRGRRVVVLIDARCDGVDSDVIEAAASASAHPLVFVQPVLETLKLARDGVVVSTVDRERVRVVATPIAVAGDMLAELTDLVAALGDPALLVAGLRACAPVELREAPAQVRRGASVG